MIKPPLRKDEKERIKALKEYSILDTLPEQEYDEITFLASYICQTPIALISLIDDKRQWFKSKYGIEVSETPKDIAFCAHAINDKNSIMIVPDSRKDDRFSDNPLVQGDPYIAFYAGIPLLSSEGFPLGTLCVIDTKPRTLNKSQLKALKALSNQLMKLFELRKNSRVTEILYKEIGEQNKNLERFASIAAHDIQSPLNSIVLLSDALKQDYSTKLEEKGSDLIDYIRESTDYLLKLVEGILSYSRNTSSLSQDLELVNVLHVINDLIQVIDPLKEAEFEMRIEEKTELLTSVTALKQIFLNLFSNAIKYNDKEKIKIRISVEEMDEALHFKISDNGPGIDPKDQQRIFEIFEVASASDRFGKNGHGIGLATVKSLVEALGGQISVSSAPEEGAIFEFTLKK